MTHLGGTAEESKCSPYSALQVVTPGGNRPSPVFLRLGQPRGDFLFWSRKAWQSSAAPWHLTL